MSLSGFPSNIDVTLGAAWLGVNGMDSGDTLSLSTQSSSSTWITYTESGDGAANDSTNRLSITCTFQDMGGGEATLALSISASNGDAWDIVATYTVDWSATAYTFLDMYGHVPQSNLGLDEYNTTYTWLDDSGTLYLNDDVLSEFQSQATTTTTATVSPVVVEVVPVTPTTTTIATVSPVVVEVTPVALFYVGPEPTVATVSPVVVEVTPVTPATMTTATVSPVVVEVTPVAPLYAGPAPTVVTVSPVVVEITPVTPTLLQTVTPDPVVIAVTPVTPTAYETVVVDPVVINVTPLTPKYAGSPPTVATVSPVVVEITPVTPVTRTRMYGAMSGRYRVFNAAEYRFFRSSTSAPQEDDTPFATGSALPSTPTPVFGDGTWRISVAYFNGCLQSGFYPIATHPSYPGAVYDVIEISSGTQITSPAAPHKLDVRQIGDGLVQIHGLYVLPDSDTYGWAIAYTTDGSTPAEDSPTVTQLIGEGPADYLVYALPSQVAGTTVKIRVQVMRYDDPTWTYSGDSVVHTVVIEADPGGVTSSDKMVGRLEQ